MCGIEPGEEAVILENHRAFGAGGGDVLAIEGGGAGVGAGHAGGDVEEGGFSAAAGTDDDDKFTRLADEGDVLEGFDTAAVEFFVDVEQLELAGVRARCGGCGGIDRFNSCHGGHSHTRISWVGRGRFDRARFLGFLDRLPTEPLW